MAVSYKAYTDYVKRLKKTNEPMSYKDYMKSELSNAGGVFRDTLSRAKSEAVKSHPTYGKSGEALGKSGLTSGGYAEYLSELSKSAYKNATASAEGKYLDAQLAADGGYAEYVKKYTDEQEKLFKSVASELSESGLNDYNAMLDFAGAAGLSLEYAKRAADYARDAITVRRKESVMRAISENRYSGKEAYEYALKLGLSPEIAAELSEYAKKLNELQLSGDYLESLKNKK